jgi:hypothetical protein
MIEKERARPAQPVGWDYAFTHTELEAMLLPLRCAVYEITEDIRRRNPDVPLDTLRNEVEAYLRDEVEVALEVAVEIGLEDADDRFLPEVGTTATPDESIQDLTTVITRIANADAPPIGGRSARLLDRANWIDQRATEFESAPIPSEAGRRLSERSMRLYNRLAVLFETTGQSKH